MTTAGVATVLLTGGGPLDGKTLALPADVTRYCTGSVAAAWVTELDVPLEQTTGPDLGCYRYTQTRDDGCRVFGWVRPGS